MLTFAQQRQEKDLSAHQRYLEAPYDAAARDELAFEYWEENIARADYDRLMEAGVVEIDKDEEGYEPLCFEDWLGSRQGHQNFESWMNEMEEGR